MTIFTLNVDDVDVTKNVYAYLSPYSPYLTGTSKGVRYTTPAHAMYLPLLSSHHAQNLLQVHTPHDIVRVAQVFYRQAKEAMLMDALSEALQVVIRGGDKCVATFVEEPQIRAMLGRTFLQGCELSGMERLLAGGKGKALAVGKVWRKCLDALKERPLLFHWSHAVGEFGVNVSVCSPPSGTGPVLGNNLAGRALEQATQKDFFHAHDQTILHILLVYTFFEHKLLKNHEDILERFYGIPAVEWYRRANVADLSGGDDHVAELASFLRDMDPMLAASIRQEWIRLLHQLDAPGRDTDRVRVIRTEFFCPGTLALECTRLHLLTAIEGARQQLSLVLVQALAEKVLSHEFPRTGLSPEMLLIKAQRNLTQLRADQQDALFWKTLRAWQAGSLTIRSFHLAGIEKAKSKWDTLLHIYKRLSRYPTVAEHFHVRDFALVIGDPFPVKRVEGISRLENASFWGKVLDPRRAMDVVFSYGGRRLLFPNLLSLALFLQAKEVLSLFSSSPQQQDFIAQLYDLTLLRPRKTTFSKIKRADLIPAEESHRIAERLRDMLRRLQMAALHTVYHARIQEHPYLKVLLVASSVAGWTAFKLQSSAPPVQEEIGPTEEQLSVVLNHVRAAFLQTEEAKRLEQAYRVVLAYLDTDAHSFDVMMCQTMLVDTILESAVAFDHEISQKDRPPGVPPPSHEVVWKSWVERPKTKANFGFLFRLGDGEADWPPDALEAWAALVRHHKAPAFLSKKIWPLLSLFLTLLKGRRVPASAFRV